MVRVRVRVLGLITHWLEKYGLGFYSQYGNNNNNNKKLTSNIIIHNCSSETPSTVILRLSASLASFVLGSVQ